MSAIDGGYRPLFEQVEAGNVTGVTGLLAAGDLPPPEPYGADGSA